MIPAVDYRPWYWKNRWRYRAKRQLRDEPLCAMCSKEGRVVTATIADHKIPHKGNERLFWEGELQSLCKFHHDLVKKREELGRIQTLDDDGWPQGAA
jgi:5-methylcytosine-specific restriction protein A